MISFCSALFARGFSVEVVTPAYVQITLSTGDRLAIMVGKGNACSTAHPYMHHAPDALFRATDAEVGLLPEGARTCTEIRGFQTTAMIEEWISALEKGR